MYKLIIIEDEKLTRDGIERLVRNSDTGFEMVGAASDGEQGLELVKEKNPDVIITDIYMPKINGLDLIENVMEINPETYIIIMSGYDDFKYAQRAVHLGVKEYLLKPVLPEQIRDVLLRTKNELDMRRNFLMNIENLRSRVLESLPVLRDRFFSELISGSLSDAQIAAKLRYLDIDMDGGLYCVILLKISNSQSDFSVSEPDREGYLQLFLNNAIDQLFDKNIIIYQMHKPDNQIVLIFCIKHTDYSNVFMLINQNTARIVAKLRKYLNIRAYASIGKLYRNIQDIARSYKEAFDAMSYTFSEDSGYVINYEDVSLHDKAYIDKPVQLEKQLLVNVKLSNRQAALKTMEDIFAEYEKYGIDASRLIKPEIFEIVMLLTRSINEECYCNNGYFQYDQMEVYGKISGSSDFDELKNWCAGFIDLCIEEYNKAKLSKGEVITEKIKEYVENCLQDEDFSLDRVAENLYMSPNYLRKIFKQHTGSSFVDYLTAKRMEKAAALLRIRSLNIQDISEKVGYSNQRYFASCFKKYYGLTPSDYRDAQFE